MVKNNTCAGHALRIAYGITILLLLLTGLAGAAPSGNRIWDESLGMPTTYTWNSLSFAGFYYNLNDNLGTEELTISDIKRTIARGDISYKTSPIEVNFDYSGFGRYQVIGFMADKYFAGYTENSVISNNDVKSMLGRNQLHKVLLDDDEKRVISEGGTLTLKEGYVLKVKEMDIGAGPGQVLVVLLKDGEEVDSSAVEGRSTYVYSKKVGTAEELPIIAVHFDTVFRGREVNAAFIKGVFQISESYTSLSTGDRYGEMEISSISASGIEMRNRNPVALNSGTTVDLVGDLKIVVADSSVLRFALSVEKVGTFEARGTVYPPTMEWTPLNFGLNVGGANVGFYYDMNRDIGNERLKIESISGNSIPRDRLKYTSMPQEVSFDYSDFGKYQVVGFIGDKYFAGYTANSVISSEARSMLDSKKLIRVLLDDKSKYTVPEGGTLTLKDGYVLKMNGIDTGVGPGQVWLALLKDGTVVDDGVIAGKDNYVYYKKVGNGSEIPIIAVHVDAVFRGREMNAVFIKGVFQISDNFTLVHTGDRYGELELKRFDAGGIEMRNRNAISLSSGSTVDLMGNIKFKVADSSTVRFYPYVIVTPEMMAYQLSIDAPAKATAGDTITIKTTSGGKPVEGVSIAINSDIGQTDKDGILNYTLRKTMKGGTYNINATKIGYQKVSKGIEIQEYLENRLGIEAPAKANQFEAMTIRVTYKGSPVSGATVIFDNVTIGLTDSSGALNYTPEASGTHTIYASKSGYTTSARDIEIRVPFAEFKALDISTASDVVFTNEDAIIRSNVTNIGTKTDTLPVGLIINNTEVNSMPVTVAPGEIKEIIFKQRVNLQPGNYTIEVLGQKKVIEVRESQYNIFLIIGAIIGIGAVIIYFMTAKSRISLKALKKLPEKSEKKGA